MTEKDKELLEDLFTYHQPEPGDKERYEAITAATRAFAAVVLEQCPPSADRSAAIRKIREARMTANAAIACKGKG